MTRATTRVLRAGVLAASVPALTGYGGDHPRAPERGGVAEADSYDGRPEVLPS